MLLGGKCFDSSSLFSLKVSGHTHRFGGSGWLGQAEAVVGGCVAEKSRGAGKQEQKPPVCMPPV